MLSFLTDDPGEGHQPHQEPAAEERGAGQGPGEGVCASGAPIASGASNVYLPLLFSCLGPAISSLHMTKH